MAQAQARPLETRWGSKWRAPAPPPLPPPPPGGGMSNNNATSTVSHYNLAYGITTAKPVADSDSMAFVITQLTGAAVAVASFKLLASTLPVGQHHRRPQAVASRRDPSGSRARF